MASMRSKCWSSARLAYRSFQMHPRGFSHSASYQTAHNLVMPAMSPTMTEGNIATWKLKEGDSFSAGDVLLEIETDKAQMDVEAQDDGVLAKITAQDGAKSVSVGTRIAVLADVGDDLSSLEIPEEDRASTPSTSAEASDKSEPASPPPSDHAPTPAPKQDSSSTLAKQEPQKYPLYPAVEHLLHTSGLSTDDLSKIPTSGPNGRLLKGDVLAYLGKVDKSYPADQSKRIAKLSHLDLSNIKVAPKARDAEAKKASPPVASKEPATITEVALPVSLSSVIATQKRVQDALGIFLPLSTFIARASELANDELPPAKRAPTSDDLFNAVLGLDKVAGPTRASRGNFIPSMRSMLPTGTAQPTPTQMKKGDIIDILTGSAAAKPSATGAMTRQAIPTSSAVRNVFSVVVPKGEEVRAKVYLERMKSLLEVETGRLVL